MIHVYARGIQFKQIYYLEILCMLYPQQTKMLYNCEQCQQMLLLTIYMQLRINQVSIFVLSNTYYVRTHCMYFVPKGRNLQKLEILTHNG